jgi:hypothetical protein
MGENTCYRVISLIVWPNITVSITVKPSHRLFTKEIKRFFEDWGMLIKSLKYYLFLEIQILKESALRLTVQRVMGFACHSCGFEGEKGNRWK